MAAKKKISFEEGVAQLEAALQHGDRGLSAVHNDLDGRLQHAVLFLAGLAGRSAAARRFSLAFDVFHDLF